MRTGELIEEIRRRRGGEVLVLASTSLDLEILPTLYDRLRPIGRVERLDVVLLCRGGVVNAARRIALLLRHFADELCVIVPHHCESAGAILLLAADEIIAGPVAIFSPVDPLLQTAGPGAGDAPPAIFAEDVRLFSQMGRDWFGLEAGEARRQAFSILCENVFPTTLTSFYRSTLETQAICEELLAARRVETAEASRAAIVKQLLFGHHSHTYALTREEMKAIGLAVRADPEIEDLAWEISRTLHDVVGPGSRGAREDGWFDTLIADRAGATRRRRMPGEPDPKWEALDIA